MRLRREAKPCDSHCPGRGLLRPVRRADQCLSLLEEILKRFPEWEVDLSCAELSPTATLRGWEAMPAVLG